MFEGDKTDLTNGIRSTDLKAYFKRILWTVNVIMAESYMKIFETLYLFYIDFVTFHGQLFKIKKFSKNFIFFIHNCTKSLTHYVCNN